MTKSPAVSVLTVVRNGMPFLPLTVKSVLAQTFRDFEYVIVDDGSTDGTAEYLQGLTDPSVRIVRCEKIGLANVRNIAISEAQGDLLANIDADDVAYPNRLLRQVDFFHRNPDYVVVGSQVDLIDSDGQIFGERRFPCTDAALRFQMHFGCPFAHPATTYRRDAAIRCGAFRAEFNYTEDYEFWSRLAMEGRLANLADKLTAYRIHPTSVTSRHSDVHTRHSCQLVVGYAERLQIAVSAEAISGLFRFLQSGHLPESASMSELVECYSSIRAHFETDVVSDELACQFGIIQQRLRWHCLENAKRSLPNLIAFCRWMKLARQFDPEDGTLRRIGGRAVRRLFGWN